MNTLRTKDIDFDNYERVYEYYTQDHRRPCLARMAFSAMGVVYDPQVSFAEGVQEQISQSLDDNIPSIFVLNHLRYVDHLVWAGACKKTDPLKRIVDNSFIWGKVDYFKSQPSRFISESLSTLPVIRRQDVDPDISLMDFGRSVAKLMEVSEGLVVSGRNVNGFGEGTRNIGDPTVVMPLEQGFSILALKTWKKDIPAKIVPVGLAYEGTKWRGASVYVGDPILPHQTTRTALTELLQSRIQASVDASIAMIAQRAA